jgi:hypothetical protein
MEQQYIGEEYYTKLFNASKDSREAISIGRLKELLSSNGEIFADDYQKSLPSQNPTERISKASFCELMGIMQQTYGAFASETFKPTNFKLFLEIEFDTSKQFTHPILTKIASAGVMDISRREVVNLDTYINSQLVKNEKSLYDRKSAGPANLPTTTNLKMAAFKTLWNLFDREGGGFVDGIFE